MPDKCPTSDALGVSTWARTSSTQQRYCAQATHQCLMSCTRHARVNTYMLSTMHAPASARCQRGQPTLLCARRQPATNNGNVCWHEVVITITAGRYAYACHSGCHTHLARHGDAVDGAEGWRPRIENHLQRKQDRRKPHGTVPAHMRSPDRRRSRCFSLREAQSASCVAHTSSANVDCSMQYPTWLVVGCMVRAEGSQRPCCCRQLYCRPCVTLLRPGMP